ncbi:uncharacterized protein KD926_009419 [Aspergillus affinis]|uniref:uncharacterized protein n=1 Tax=Aspergillus affinis TaxID=1070780 RepID=UPI0022FEA2A8|nr:uncharacterized protein KD926_009419 [Aspergillus affinis]KAI9039405.1 hypothetical protein KD926_009419 [Aspergillus affinis]
MPTPWFICVLVLLSIRASAGLSQPAGPLYARQIDQNDKHYYLGYKGPDYRTPWAKYFNDTQPVKSAEMISGLQESPYPGSLAVKITAGPQALNAPGYARLENGYSFLPDGSLTLNIRFDVPGNVTGEMLGFWFSWHINDTRKYKLWNPEAHQYAAINLFPEKAVQPAYTGRYWNVTSFVDEYIGITPYKPSIGLFDPELMGFSNTNKQSGVLGMISAFVSLLSYHEQDEPEEAKHGLTPLSAVLVHQLRARPDGRGNEVRSRFWFGNILVLGMSVAGGPEKLAHDLSAHCFNEMSHLNTFLPDLFNEFRQDVATGY